MISSNSNASKSYLNKNKKNNSSLGNSTPLSTTHKSIIIANFSKRYNKNYHNKSQFNTNYQKYILKSNIKINNSYRLKLLSPQNSSNSKNLSNIETKKILLNNEIYNSILTKIENIKNLYEKELEKLHNILIKIEDSINIIIKEESNKNRDDIESKCNKIKSLKGQILKFKMKNLDENKINKFISPKASCKLNLSKNAIKEKGKDESESHIYKRKVNKLSQKINEMNLKFRIKELNYLFYIGECENKITKLEKQLNVNSIEKLSKNELKKVLCYPNYLKFDVKEDVNVKSIPMYNKRKNRCQSSKIDNRYKNSIFSKSEIEASLDNNKSYEKEEKCKNIKELGKNDSEVQISTINKIFEKDKNYFLSHPKLKYIKNLNDGNKLMAWKLENQINSLPKEISKLKILSKTQKNAKVVFPSFLNETIVNLEKLRTNKNFRSIENKFEEELKKLNMKN
jgi:hypothetical protein